MKKTNKLIVTNPSNRDLLENIFQRNKLGDIDFYRCQIRFCPLVPATAKDRATGEIGPAVYIITLPEWPLSTPLSKTLSALPAGPFHVWQLRP